MFWGWGFVAARICLQYMSPEELVGLRFLFGLPVLYAIARAKRLRFDFNSAEKKSIALGSLVLTVHFLIQITGLKYTSATNTGWIISVTPLVMAVLAFLLLRERIGRHTIVGIVVATVGILLLVSRGKLGRLDWLSSVGDWLVLGSAHTWALYTVAIRDISRSRNPLAVTFCVMVPSGMLVLGYMLFTSDWGALVQIPVDGLVSILYLGIPALALAHWFWQEGVSKLGAAQAGIFLYLEPLATTALAVPLLGEHFGFFTATGGLMVLAGVFWAEQRWVFKSRRP
jgi:drug/metabolite transporter (DMT)-like permease